MNYQPTHILGFGVAGVGDIHPYQPQNVRDHRIVTVTVAQILALNATPVQLLAAPGAGKILVFDGAKVTKAAGVAYAGIAAGEDLSVKYSGAAGLEVGALETTGFLDQVTAQTRVIPPSLVAGFTPVVNAGLFLHLLVGEITTGDQPLVVTTFYHVL